MADSSLEYTVRRSARAKRIRLTVSAKDGLVVVVPAHWRGDPAPLVEQKRAWAQRALARVAERRAVLLAGPDAWLPEMVSLAASGSEFIVEYRHKPNADIRAVHAGRVLTVSGNIEDAEACLKALRRWLAREARTHVGERVHRLASAHGLHVSKLRITSARRRWGSCSSRGTVSISRNLMFLPPRLADALILHELAHLRVLDHSPRFWSALAQMDPQVLEHRRELRDAAGLVPAWADA